MEKPTYIELVPGMQHFECSRMRATLSVPACAGNWRRGHHEGDLARQGCKVGALHAGEAGASQSPLLGVKICGRCHRGATRLIGRHLCPSCWNREREVRVGKNGKGAPPVKWQTLARRTIAYRLRTIQNQKEFGFGGHPLRQIIARASPEPSENPVSSKLAGFFLSGVRIFPRPPATFV